MTKVVRLLEKKDMYMLQPSVVLEVDEQRADEKDEHHENVDEADHVAARLHVETVAQASILSRALVELYRRRQSVLRSPPVLVPCRVPQQHGPHRATVHHL